VAANVVILDSVFDLKTSGTNLKIIFCCSIISCPFKIINTGLNLSVGVTRTARLFSVLFAPPLS
jgi:hypothetical protein